MKSWWIAAVALAVSSSLVPVADAKRLGGGKSQGMQRSAPAQAAPQTPAKPAQAAPQQTSPQPTAPATAAAPATAGAAAAAAAPAKRSWLGPIAGLAAGLGLAALMSHLGLGEAFANFLMLALLAVGAALLVAFLLRRFGRSSAAGQAPAGPALSTAGASAGAGSVSAPLGIEPARVEPVMQRAPLQGADVSVTGQPLRPLGVSEASVPAPGAAEALAAQSEAAADVAPATLAASGPQLPEGFDLPAFERVAKLIFIRLQAANDKADLDDLRQFTTPELFAAIRLDLQERQGAAQHTDVEKVDARVVDYALEQGRQIVSVRFHGLVREQAGAAAEAFDEVWHLVKPEGDGGTWAIAGIQQAQ